MLGIFLSLPARKKSDVAVRVSNADVSLNKWSLFFVTARNEYDKKDYMAHQEWTFSFGYF